MASQGTLQQAIQAIMAVRENKVAAQNSHACFVLSSDFLCFSGLVPSLSCGNVFLSVINDPTIGLR